MRFRDDIAAFLSRHGYESIDPKAALIDMDGTLYDSMPRHAAAWQRMTRELGLEIAPEEFFMHEGRTGADTINLLFRRAFGRDATDDEKRELYHRKTVYFSELPEVDAMPGAAGMLRFFADRGMTRVLVTGSGQSSLIGRLDKDFPGAFAPELRVTARDVVHGKPAPDPFLAAMRLAGVTPRQSVVVENAPLGVEAGDAAGAFTIAVTTGPVPADALRDAGAAVVFSSMPECASALPELFEQIKSTTI